MNYKKPVLACFLALVCSVQANAQQSKIDQLAALNRAGQAQQAYQLALNMRPQWEGEPAFDLQYGMAAVDSGNVGEGIFALERVTMAQPNNDYARLELARAYFAVEQDDRAKAEFERVLSHNPPHEVRENILPYIDAIEARAGQHRTTWAGSAEFSSGYDSNINASPSEDSFFIPLLGGVATLSNSSMEDAFGRISLNGSVTRPVSKFTQVFSAVSLDQRSNKSGHIDTTNGGLQVGINRNLTSGTLRFALQGGTFLLEGNKYRDLVGATVSWRYVFSPRTSVTSAAQYSNLDYPELPTRNSALSLASVTLQHQLLARYRPVLSLSLSGGKENADKTTEASQANTERNILGAAIGLRLSFTSALELSTSVRAQRSRYAGMEALFQTKREDTNLIGTATLSWRANDNWLVNLAGSFGNNDSNIPITVYRRNQISIGARYLFR